MSLSRLRNIGVVAHIDAGKTTVSERILFYTGVEHRMGEVHEGSTVLDWMEEERRRGITITAAATTVPWREHAINLIDTPGHVDFTVEVERCMRVLDGAVLVIHGVAGVEAQSETVWRQMVRHRVRSVAFVNHLDRPGANFLGAVADLRRRLEAPALPVQLPLGEGREFRTVVDLLTGEAIEFPAEDLGSHPRSVPVPPREREEVEVLRWELVEALAEDDEGILEAFLEDRMPPAEALRRALRRRVLAGTLLPVLAGAALRNVGIQPLLDAVVDYLPAPDEVPPARGAHAETGAPLVRPPDPAGPRCLLAFKLVADPSEDLLFARIYSGTITPASRLYNPRVRRMERVARVLRMHADLRTPLPAAGPGEIVALTGCKFTVTGDTLCEHEEPLHLERPLFPDPVITQVVEPAASGDRDRLRLALERLSFEDPTFHVTEDEETGQWLIAGMGELHLEIKEHRLRDDFHLAVHVGRPRVAYREAPLGPGEGSGRVDRTLGGTRIFGAVSLRVQPLATSSPGPPAALVRWDPACPVPERFRAAVAEALVLEAQAGPIFGFPLSGLAIVVTGGETSPERDAEMAFVQAASQALRAALQAAKIALLEPLMAFEITAPAEFMGGILGELNARRADIADLTAGEGTRKVVGLVPLFPMFGYASTLRSLSQGRATFSLTPAGFRSVAPEDLAARGLTWS
ncbi:MAG: elongation factor G [Planctomycetota bacterium]